MTGRNIVSSDEVIGVSVKNPQGEDLGKVEKLMLDKLQGHVVFVVLSFGGFLGMGDKWFAMPWSMFSYNPDEDCFVISVDAETLKNSPGFDKNHIPDDISTPAFSKRIHDYYKTAPRSH